MCNALTTKCTVCLADRIMTCHIDCCMITGSFYIPDTKPLNLVTHLHAAHAFDTFCRITNQWKCFIPWLVFQILMKWKFYNIQIICNFLKTAVAASHTSYALTVVLRKNQFYCCTSVLSDFRTIRINDHTFLANVIAGGDQSVFSFQLYHTHATGAYFIDVFKITKTRDLNTNGSGSFHNCGILFY